MVKSNKTVKNFWMIFFGTVALLAIAAAVVLSVLLSEKISQMRMSQVSDDNVYKISRENNFRRALYAACDSMKNIDADLGKIAVSNDAAHQTKMLTDVVIHANAVNQNLADLPIAESDNLAACQRFVNQTQDYAVYLIGRLGEGNALGDSERAALDQLDNVATNLYNFLWEYGQSDSGMFIVNGNGSNNVGALSDSLDKVEQNAFTYEKLIYDGPFSESVNEKTLAGTDKKLPTEVANNLQSIFGKATFRGAINNKGVIYLFDVDGGRVITDCRGNVVQYERQSQSTGGSVGTDACRDAAKEFCAKLGYDVESVWVSKTQDIVTYVNCATVKEGVVIYPDLIKVAVDGDGSVVGLEARAYLINHRDWQPNFGSVSQDDAQKALNGGLRVTNVARALIQKDDKFLCCYEFEAEKDGRQYYVYVDSNTGKEVELFKVIENTEGFTVM